MKVVAINGSPNKNGNTARMINKAFEELNKKGIETERYNISDYRIKGCGACMKCFENKDKKCVIKSDDANKLIEIMNDADGLLIGSPTYFSNMTSELKALMDRAGLVAIANDHMWKNKVGAAIVAVRRAGAVHTFNSINHYFFINQMMVPGSSYWNLGIGLAPGDVENDEEGMMTMSNLGTNMGWLLNKLH